MENNRKSNKARGIYDSFSEEQQAMYDQIMEVSFTKDLEIFTKKELAYLIDLYERKVNSIKTSSKELTVNDLLTLIISIKLKNVALKRKVNLVKHKYTIAQLTPENKTKARKKLDNLFKRYLKP